MRAGRLRSRAEILEVPTTPDEYGEIPEAPVKLGERWCSVDALSGTENAQNSGLLSISSVRIRMRYDSLSKTLTSQHKLRIKGQLYDIKAPPVNRNNSNKTIEIIADFNQRQQP